MSPHFIVLCLAPGAAPSLLSDAYLLSVRNGHSSQSSVLGYVFRRLFLAPQLRNNPTCPTFVSVAVRQVFLNRARLSSHLSRSSPAASEEVHPLTWALLPFETPRVTLRLSTKPRPVSVRIPHPPVQRLEVVYPPYYHTAHPTTTCERPPDPCANREILSNIPVRGVWSCSPFDGRNAG